MVPNRASALRPNFATTSLPRGSPTACFHFAAPGSGEPSAPAPAAAPTLAEGGVAADTAAGVAAAAVPTLPSNGTAPSAAAAANKLRLEKPSAAAPLNGQPASAWSSEAPASPGRPEMESGRPVFAVTDDPPSCRSQHHRDRERLMTPERQTPVDHAACSTALRDGRR